MGMLFSDRLSEHEVAAARDLFDRIVAAERANLSSEQAADQRAYLLDAWENACEAVMRPIRRREELEQQLRDALGKEHPDIPF